MPCFNELQFPSGRCRRSIDLAFAVDRSESIGVANFNRIKEFLYAVILDHDVGPEFAHIAVIAFSGEAEVVFNFTRLQGADLTARNVNNLIRDIEYKPGETRIDLALTEADKSVFVDAGGWRPEQNVPKVRAEL